VLFCSKIIKKDPLETISNCYVRNGQIPELCRYVLEGIGKVFDEILACQVFDEILACQVFEEAFAFQLFVETPGIETTFQIMVKPLIGSTLLLWVNSTNYVLDIKQKLELLQ
jgi:hypothetical protein